MAIHVAERLRNGETAEAIRADLVAHGLNAEVADQLIAISGPGKWEQGVRGWVTRALGAVTMLAGATLWLGNQIGFFPTFPFAGTLAILVGGMLIALGGGKAQ